jgi:nicotinamide-nucleotide amidase
VTAYSTDAKHDVLGVPLAVLDNSGAVSAETAAAMADRVREMFGADIGVSTTGVAGPDIQEGKPVGMVFIGLVGPDAAVVNEYSFSGSRAQIREQTLETAWGLLLEAVTQTD